MQTIAPSKGHALVMAGIYRAADFESKPQAVELASETEPAQAAQEQARRLSGLLDGQGVAEAEVQEDADGNGRQRLDEVPHPAPAGAVRLQQVREPSAGDAHDGGGGGDPQDLRREAGGRLNADVLSEGGNHFSSGTFVERP